MTQKTIVEQMRDKYNIMPEFTKEVLRLFAEEVEMMLTHNLSTQAIIMLNTKWVKLKKSQGIDDSLKTSENAKRSPMREGLE